MDNWEPCNADGRVVDCQQPLWGSVWCFVKHLTNKAAEPRALPLWSYSLGKLKSKRHSHPKVWDASVYKNLVYRTSSISQKVKNG